MKRLHLFFFSIILVSLLAACGSSSATSGSSYGNTNSNAPTPIATTNTAASTPTVASTTGAVIHTASTTVNGKTVTLLTDAKGMTLDYFQPDTATTSACTGGCTSIWPPYLSNVTPAKGTLSGALALQTNANGSQVTYNGHPLYTYASDTAPGQTNGEGVGDKWFVATDDLAVLKGSSSAGGYGY